MAKRQRPHGPGSLFKRDGRGPWVARWFDHTGKRREASTRTTDRAAAERILAKRIADAALRRDGVIDARDDRYAAAARRPLAEHVADWRAALIARGVTAKHSNMHVSRATRVINMVSAERIGDLTASAVQSAVGALRADGLGLKTCGGYLTAIKGFSRWLRRNGRIREDVLSHLAGFNAATDRRHERRPLTANELCQLIQTTEHAPTWRRMTGTDRAILYRVATGTGYRASELRSLTPSSFRLDDDPPAVMLLAAHSKHRRDDIQPIRSDLAELLGTWLDGKPADTPVFATMPDKTALMLRLDLRRARARWIRAVAGRVERRDRRESSFLAVTDDAGRVVDFHALRTTYITMLVKGGASVKVAQELARHSDPKLTMNVYTQLGIRDLAGALDFLPSTSTSPQHRERMRATGTDDARPINDPRQKPRQLERETVRNSATRCQNVARMTTTPNVEKTTMFAESNDSMRENAKQNENTPGETRTPDPRIRNPMPESITDQSTTTYNDGSATPASNPDTLDGNSPGDPDLAAVVEAWPDLPDAIRAGIVAMVEAAAGR